MNLHEAFSLEGETALITGGGTGLGLGIAKCFVAAGARVIIAGRRPEVLESAVRELGPQASYEQHDVSQLDAAPALVEKIAASVAPMTILVNNAGIHLKKLALETTPEEFNAVLQTHVLAGFALSRAVLPSMIAARHGSILFTSSMAALFGVPKVLAYSAAKTACTGMVRGLAAEVSCEGVRVNAIAPGWIESEMLRKALSGDPERSAKIIGRTPMASFGSADDIGWAATYLCSPAAKFVTGVVLPVDGGASIGF